MQLGLSSWWPLCLLLLVPLGGWVAFRSRRGMERWRSRTVHILRASSIVCVIAALCGPTVQTPSDDVSVVYALDVSHSVSPQSVRSAMAWIRDTNERFRPAQSRFVLFADRARLLTRIDDIDRVPVSDSQDRTSMAIDQSATDLEAGVAAALAGFRPEHAKRLVLITDGKQTRGDVWRQLSRLRNERVRVHTMPAPTGYSAEAWLDGLDVPENVRRDEPVVARIRLMATASMRGRLELRVKDEVRLERSVSLAVGRNDVEVDLRFLREGENPVKVSFTAPGGRTDSSVSSVWVGPRLRLLHVEGGSTGSHYLAEALEANGIDVTAIGSARFTEDAATALNEMDAVLLSDVNAESGPLQRTRAGRSQTGERR